MNITEVIKKIESEDFLDLIKSIDRKFKSNVNQIEPVTLEQNITLSVKSLKILDNLDLNKNQPELKFIINTVEKIIYYAEKTNLNSSSYSNSFSQLRKFAFESQKLFYLIARLHSQIEVLILNSHYETIDFSKFKNELKEVRAIKKRYTNLVEAIKESEELNRRINAINLKSMNYLEEIKSSSSSIELIKETINNNDKSINGYLLHFDETSNHVTSIKEEIDLKKADVKLFTDKIDAYNEDLSNKEIEFKEKIDTLEKEQKTFIAEISEEVKNLNEKLNNSTQTTIDNTTSLVSEKVTEWEISANNAITKNETLQATIETLLRGGNVAKLAEIFKTNQEQIEKPQNKWLYATVITFGLLLAASLTLTFFIDADDNFQQFIIKYTSLTPVLILAIFCLTQFNKNRNLIEEYRFKNSIVTSLLEFEKLIGRSKEDLDDDSIQFIIKSFEEIYRPPTLKRGKEKDDKNFILNVTDKIVDAVEKLKPS